MKLRKGCPPSKAPAEVCSKIFETEIPRIALKRKCLHSVERSGLSSNSCPHPLHFLHRRVNWVKWAAKKVTCLLLTIAKVLKDTYDPESTLLLSQESCGVLITDISEYQSAMVMVGGFRFRLMTTSHSIFSNWWQMDPPLMGK